MCMIVPLVAPRELLGVWRIRNTVQTVSIIACWRYAWKPLLFQEDENVNYPSISGLHNKMTSAGVRAGSDGYSSGFGVISQPTVATTELTGLLMSSSM